MGTPNYRPDPGKTIRDMNMAIGRVFTPASSARDEGRPWGAMTVSDVASARWPSTTSASFTRLQMAAGTRSHPNVRYWARVAAPAGGAEFRITDSGGNVLVSPVSCASGTNEIEGSVSIPGTVLFWGEFEIYFEVRSLVAGQTTSMIVPRAYGRA